MKPLAKIALLAFIVSGALLAGCNTAPVHEVIAQPIPVASGKPVSLSDVERAITKGAIRAGWQVTPEAPGRLSARIDRGSYNATVGLEFDTKVYSMKLRDTTMRSDGTMVHKRYNIWARNLDQSIRAELSGIGQ